MASFPRFDGTPDFLLNQESKRPIGPPVNSREELSRISPERMAWHWGYVSGFFDGEGSVNPEGQRPGVGLFFHNNHKPILQMIREIIASGYIDTRASRSPKHKTSYVLKVFRHEDVLRISDEIVRGMSMSPYSGEFIKQAKLQEQAEFIRNRTWHEHKRMPLGARQALTLTRLRELYYEKGLSLKELGRAFDVGPTAIRRWMQTYGVSRRRPGMPKRVVPSWAFRNKGRLFCSACKKRAESCKPSASCPQEHFDIYRLRLAAKRLPEVSARA